MNFSFTSADSPASVNGNSVFFPTTAVDTFFVYPVGPFSDPGHEFVARNSVVLKLKSARFDGANNTVTLTPRKAFSLTKKLSQNGKREGDSPILLRKLRKIGTVPGRFEIVSKAAQLVISASLEDNEGQPIDGNHDGRPGGNASAVLRRNGTTLS